MRTNTPIAEDNQPPRRGRRATAALDESCEGLHYGPARDLREVLQAWRLVYRSYLRTGLIHPNPQRIHTLLEAVGPHSAVLLRRIGPVVASTLTAYLDGPAGLPLDHVYAPELAVLRADGRRLSEVGLFADRREELARSLNGVLELMRHAFYYTLRAGADDVLIGVHPRHAPFYRRLIGFEMAGEQRTCPSVLDHAVVLLRLDLRAAADHPRPPRGLRYFLENPLPADHYTQRYRFDTPSVVRSAISPFLRSDVAAMAV